jgi:hypothetical protein
MSDQFTIYSRGKHQRTDEAVAHTGDDPLAAFDEAHRYSEHPVHSEPVLTWPDIEEFAVADIDWHGDEVPKCRTEAWRIRHLGPGPKPDRLWLSHGGGVKAAFVRQGIYTANELAALWAFNFTRTHDAHGWTGAEVKSECFHPGYCRLEGSEVLLCSEVLGGTYGESADEALGRVLGSRGTVPEHVRDAWLEEQGFVLGQSYEHDKCPIDPNSESHGKPVWIGDEAVYCHRCDALGNGVMYYANLISSPEVLRPSNLFRCMVEGLCHWEHAQHVLRHLNVPDKIARLLYVAGLKRVHLSDERVRAFEQQDGQRVVEKLATKIAHVFACRIPMVRAYGGLWVNSDDLSTVVDRELQSWLDCLPGCRFLHKRTLKNERNKRTYGMMLGGGDLTAVGYPPLTILHGVDARPNRLPDDRVRIVKAADPPFRRDWERGVEWAEQRIVESFPGICIPYLRLLVYAKVFAQTDLLEPCIVYVIGATGAGKTMTLYLAGEIALSPVEEICFEEEHNRLMQQFATACCKTDLVLVDEVAQNPRYQDRLTKIVLSMKRNKPYHHMYVGPKTISRCPAVVFADTKVAPSFREDPQLARRTVFVELGGGRGAAEDARDWKLTCGTGDVKAWRRGDGFTTDNQEACDVFLADCIEKAQQFQTFHQAAESLGFRTFDQETDDFDVNGPLKDLFVAVCEDTTPITSSKTHWKGPGWVVFRPDYESTRLVVKAWTDCVGETGKQIQRVTAAQWSQVLGLSQVEIDVMEHRQQIGVRFRVGRPRCKGTVYNIAIPGAVELIRRIKQESNG